MEERKGLMGGAFQRGKHRGTMEDDVERKMCDHELTAQEDRENRGTCSRG